MFRDVESLILVRITAQAVTSPVLGPTEAQADEFPISHCGCLGSISVRSMWDLWWTWRQKDNFFPSSSGCSCQCHFTNVQH